jgi:hypothetical protein
MWHGMFLFFLGLCTGLVEQQFSNSAIRAWGLRRT